MKHGVHFCAQVNFNWAVFVGMKTNSVYFLVHSIIRTSPKSLLAEIILVDDASERGMRAFNLDLIMSVLFCFVLIIPL